MKWLKDEKYICSDLTPESWASYYVRSGPKDGSISSNYNGKQH